MAVGVLMAAPEFTKQMYDDVTPPQYFPIDVLVIPR
jgi:hypothetical protein